MPRERPSDKVIPHINSQVSNWRLFAVALIAIAVIYFPSALLPFKIHDDYWLTMMREPPSGCRDTPEWASMMSIGRILGAEVTRCVEYPLYQHFGDQVFMYFRLADCLFLGLATFLLWKFLLFLTEDLSLSFATTILFACLPGISLLIAASASASHMFALPALAVCVYIAALFPPPSRRLRLLARNSLVGDGVWYFAIAALIAGLIFAYQTHFAFLFIFPLGIALFSRSFDWQRNRVIGARVFSVITIAGALNLAIQKFVITPYFRGAAIPAGTRNFYLTTSLSGMFHNVMVLYRDLGPWLASLWVVHPGRGIREVAVSGALLVFASGLAMLAVAVFQTLRIPKRRWELVERTGLGVASFAALHTAQLLRPDALQYRTLYPVAAGFVMLLMWWFKGTGEMILPPKLSGAVRYPVFAITVLAAVLAQYNTVSKFAVPAVAELNYLRASLEPLLYGDTDEVTIKRPSVPAPNSFSPDEFEMMTSRWRNYYGVQGMVRRILEDAGKPAGFLTVTNDGDTYVRITRPDRVPSPGGSRFADMGHLRLQPSDGLFSISASSTLQQWGPQGLLTPDIPATAWHAMTPPHYPEWVRMHFSGRKRIAEIRMLPQPGLDDRRPKRVAVETSDDGTEWRTAQVGEDACVAGKPYTLHLPRPIVTSDLRLSILSNCGNPQLLTVQYIILR